MRHWSILLLVGTLVSSAHGMASASSPDAGTLALIAGEIEDLKEKYPQLKEFAREKNAIWQTLKKYGVAECRE